MNRRKFALSWGRKLIFGISWPLSTLLALVYLRSFILPEKTIELVFFGTAFIGHFGILNVLVYFLLYCPIAFLMPSYYISRLWSLILILGLNFFILIDALTFSSYHEHIYSYLGKIFLEIGPQYLFGSNAASTLIYVGFFILAILIWLRGEMLWRAMKGRFSNPVKSWYLVLIVLCLGISKLLFYYGMIGPDLAAVFPFDQNFATQSHVVKTDKRKFYYPSQDTVCSGKQNPNIVLLVIKEWDNSELTAEQSPILFHLKKHGMSFNSHYSGGTNADNGLFSLLYSIPASYQTSVKGQNPAIFTELEKRKYDVVSVSDGSQDPLAEISHWVDQRNVEVMNPFYLSVMFKRPSVETETFIKNITLLLQIKDLLNGTHLLITGAFGHSGLTPLIYIDSARKTGEVSHMTSHYDVLPSIMQKIWNCKKIFKTASIGMPLEQVERDWLLVTGQEGFKIVDYRTDKIIQVQNGVLSGEGRKELVFPALKLMTHFGRPH